MKRIFSTLLLLLVIVSLVLSACTPAQPAADQTGGEEQTSGEETTGEEMEMKEVTLTIGFTASTSGKYNVESTRQINGLNLWMNQVNDAGGIHLEDGTVVKFTSKFYDDESTAERVQELYTRLATEDNADFLISPYSSGLTDASAVIAEQYGKVMITTGAASDSTYQKGYTLVYQTYTPASRYLTGALDLLAATDSSVKKIAIVHETDKFSTDVATALNAYAESLGYEVVLFEGYASETTDFAPFINKIQEAAPDAIFGGGHFQDGSTFAKQLAEKEVPVKFVALLVAPPEPTFAELGDAALGIVGPSQWEPLANFNADAAASTGMSFFGPSSKEFADMYMKAYSEEPSYHAAGGFVAGLLLQKAIEDAQSTDPAVVKTALDAIDVITFFGHMKFDTTAENHGLQIGHSMVYIQWQGEGTGAEALAKQVVWPAEGASAETLFPIP
ncbi:MAG: amino acid ABC transporter substrate-binding protein [Anaerolineales bacterium]|nr:amino acid ABC transporter substrate-binding protein [Anaerolineales bacterium]